MSSPIAMKRSLNRFASIPASVIPIDEESYTLFSGYTVSMYSPSLLISMVATIEISKDGEYIETVYPEKRVYDSSSMGMTEAGIEANLFRDLFIAIGEDIGGGSWSMHLQYKPLLRLIWYGPIVMMMGGLIWVFLSKRTIGSSQ